MSDDNKEKKWFDKKISRRDFLKKAGIAGAGVAVGATGVGAIMSSLFGNVAEQFEGKDEISFRPPRSEPAAPP